MFFLKQIVIIVGATAASSQPIAVEAQALDPGQPAEQSTLDAPQPLPDNVSPPDSHESDGDPFVSALGAMSLEELLDIKVVTASGGKEESLRSSAANITLVTADQIYRHQWRSLADILAFVPGLYLTDDLTSPALSVRGINGGLRSGTRLLKIMINGVEVLYRPDLTAFIGPEYIPVEAIERVEIVKGPLSALYGANAFLATVNVITKTPKQGGHATVGLRGHWQQTSPNPGQGVSLLAEYASEKMDVLAALSLDRIDRSGLRVQQTFPEQDLPRFQSLFANKSDDDISAPISMFLRVDARPTSLGTFTVQAGLQEFQSDAEFLLNSVTTGASTLAIYNFWTHADHQLRWSDRIASHLGIGFGSGKPRSTTKLYLSAGDDRYYLPDYGYSALDAVGDMSADFELAEIKVGFDLLRDQEDVLVYRQVLVDGSPSGQDFGGIVRERTLSNYGFYAGVRSKDLPGVEGLKLTGNLRADLPQYTDDYEPWQISWRLAGIYEFSDQFAAKLFAGRAFQGPSATLLFAQPGNFGFGNENNVFGQRALQNSGLASGKLSTQKSQSLEFVLSSQLADILSINAGGFLQDISNRIEFNAYGPNFVATNAGSSRYVGVEGDIRLVVGRFTGQMAGSYERQVEMDDEEVPEHMPHFPTYQLFASLNLAVPEVFTQLTALGRYMGPRGPSAANVILNNLQIYHLPAWGEIDLTLSTVGLQMLGSESESVVAFSVRNLLNTRHSEPGFGGLDTPSRGRSVLFTLQQRW